MAIVGFDLGGTYLRCGTVQHGALSALERVRLDVLAADGEGVWTAVLEHMAQYVGRAGLGARSAWEIVVSFPGPVLNGSSALCAPTVRGNGSTTIDFAARLEAITNLPVTLINDVSAATWFLQRRIDADRFAVVTVSSGIGSKLFDRAAGVVLDHLPYSGEIGHVVVDDDPAAPFCDCGGRGHLGGIASGRGTERLARTIARTDVESFRASLAASFGTDIEQLTNEDHLVPAARLGDEWTWRVIRTAMRPLAATLASLTYAAGLQRIVVIGGFAQALGRRYASELEDAIARFGGGPLFRAPHGSLVTLWEADGNACLEGAVEFGLARQRVCR